MFHHLQPGTVDSDCKVLVNSFPVVILFLRTSSTNSSKALFSTHCSPDLVCDPPLQVLTNGGQILFAPSIIVNQGNMGVIGAVYLSPRDASSHSDVWLSLSTDIAYSWDNLVRMTEVINGSTILGLDSDCAGNYNAAIIYNLNGTEVRAFAFYFDNITTYNASGVFLLNHTTLDSGLVRTMAIAAHGWDFVAVWDMQDFAGPTLYYSTYRTVDETWSPRQSISTISSPYTSNSATIYIEDSDTAVLLAFVSTLTNNSPRVYAQSTPDEAKL